MIEWNSHSLQGKSFQEVADIITESREEPQVELIVARNLSGLVETPMTALSMNSRELSGQNQWRQHEPLLISQHPHHKGNFENLPC